MKKLIGMIIAGVAVLALSGCSGDSVGVEYVIVDTTVHADTRIKHHTAKDNSGKIIIVDDEVYDDGRDDVVYGISHIDIQDLDDGYVVRGYSSYGNDVKLMFLDGQYRYQRIDPDSGEVTEEFNGYFDLENGAIKIYFGDDDGGGYAIDTHNGFLEVGYFYDIIGVQDDITVMEIYNLD